MHTFPDLMARAVEGVFAIDGEQRVIFWNQACEKLTGIPAASALGDNCHDVLKGRDTHGRPLCKSNCPLCELSKGGPPPAQLPMRITHVDGNSLQLNVGTMLIPSSRQNQWNVVHVMRRGRECGAVEEQRGRVDKTVGFEVGKSAMHQAMPSQIAASLLTSREREILRLLADGEGVMPMSDQLHISVTTVRNHIQRLMAKLDVHSRVEAVAYAHRHRLI
jgi:DNA-binding CsgD family transcriptional regulator